MAWALQLIALPARSPDLGSLAGGGGVPIRTATRGRNAGLRARWLGSRSPLAPRRAAGPAGHLEREAWRRPPFRARLRGRFDATRHEFDDVTSASGGQPFSVPFPRQPTAGSTPRAESNSMLGAEQARARGGSEQQVCSGARVQPTSFGMAAREDLRQISNPILRSNIKAALGEGRGGDTIADMCATSTLRRAGLCSDPPNVLQH